MELGLFGQYTEFDDRLRLDAELATWKPTFSLRLDPGTIAIDRVTEVPLHPRFAEAWTALEARL